MRRTNPTGDNPSNAKEQSSDRRPPQSWDSEMHQARAIEREQRILDRKINKIVPSKFWDIVEILIQSTMPPVLYDPQNFRGDFVAAMREVDRLIGYIDSKSPFRSLQFKSTEGTKPLRNFFDDPINCIRGLVFSFGICDVFEDKESLKLPSFERPRRRELEDLGYLDKRHRSSENDRFTLPMETDFLHNSNSYELQNFLTDGVEVGMQAVLPPGESPVLFSRLKEKIQQKIRELVEIERKEVKDMMDRNAIGREDESTIFRTGKNDLILTDRTKAKKESQEQSPLPPMEAELNPVETTVSYDLCKKEFIAQCWVRSLDRMLIRHEEFVEKIAPMAPQILNEFIYAREQVRDEIIDIVKEDYYEEKLGVGKLGLLREVGSFGREELKHEVNKTKKMLEVHQSDEVIDEESEEFSLFLCDKVRALSDIQAARTELRDGILQTCTLDDIQAVEEELRDDTLRTLVRLISLSKKINKGLIEDSVDAEKLLQMIQGSLIPQYREKIKELEDRQLLEGVENPALSQDLTRLREELECREEIVSYYKDMAEIRRQTEEAIETEMPEFLNDVKELMKKSRRDTFANLRSLVFVRPDILSKISKVFPEEPLTIASDGSRSYNDVREKITLMSDEMDKTPSGSSRKKELEEIFTVVLSQLVKEDGVNNLCGKNFLNEYSKILKPLPTTKYRLPCVLGSINADPYDGLFDCKSMIDIFLESSNPIFFSQEGLLKDDARPLFHPDSRYSLKGRQGFGAMGDLRKFLSKNKVNLHVSLPSVSPSIIAQLPEDREGLDIGFVSEFLEARPVPLGLEGSVVHLIIRRMTGPSIWANDEELLALKIAETEAEEQEIDKFRNRANQRLAGTSDLVANRAQGSGLSGATVERYSPLEFVDTEDDFDRHSVLMSDLVDGLSDSNTEDNFDRHSILMSDLVGELSGSYTESDSDEDRAFKLNFVGELSGSDTESDSDRGSSHARNLQEKRNEEREKNGAHK